MSDRPILICYDGSEASDGAIDAAAELLGPRRAVVLNVGPVLTTAEAWAATSSVVPGNAFDDLNTAAAHERVDAGVEHARRAGFTAEARTEARCPEVGEHRRRRGRDRRRPDRHRLAGPHRRSRAVRGEHLARGGRARGPPGPDRARCASALSRFDNMRLEGPPGTRRIAKEER